MYIHINNHKVQWLVLLIKYIFYYVLYFHLHISLTIFNPVLTNRIYLITNAKHA